MSMSSSMSGVGGEDGEGGGDGGDALSAFGGVDGGDGHGQGPFGSRRPEQFGVQGWLPRSRWLPPFARWGGWSRGGRLVASGKRSVTAGVVDGTGLP